MDMQSTLAKLFDFKPTPGGCDLFIQTLKDISDYGTGEPSLMIDDIFTIEFEHVAFAERIRSSDLTEFFNNYFKACGSSKRIKVRETQYEVSIFAVRPFILYDKRIDMDDADALNI